MRITIVRHGRPDFEWERHVKGSEFSSLESAYDSAGIVGHPSDESLGLVSRHRCIVCSDLPRSIQSAQALGAESIHLSSAVFREMNLPYFDNVPVRMPLKYWVVLLRTLWFFGFSKNAESISNAKARARLATQQLVELAREHQSVLLVGHGFMNHYVARELLANHWVGPRSPGKEYWAFGTYEYAGA